MTVLAALRRALEKTLANAKAKDSAMTPGSSLRLPSISKSKRANTGTSYLFMAEVSKKLLGTCLEHPNQVFLILRL